MNAVYLRISTDEQNLDTQRDVIQEFLTNKGMKATWFEDNGYSGDTVRRPAFTAMRKDKDVSCVVVFRLDRLSRKTHVGISLLKNWLDKGVRVISVMEGIDLDPSNPDQSGVIADIIVPLLFGLAQNEQRIRRTRQAAGIARAKREGKYTGRKAGSTKKKPAEALRLHKRGLKPSEIAKQLGISKATAWRYLQVAV